MNRNTEKDDLNLVLWDYLMLLKKNLPLISYKPVCIENIKY